MKQQFLIPLIYCSMLIACRPAKEGECSSTFFDKSDDRMIFENNTNEKLYGTFSYYYPSDSNRLSIFIPTETPPEDDRSEIIIQPQSSFRYTSSGCWEGRFKNVIESDTLRVLVFNLDSLSAYNYDGEQIIQRNLYKSYLFTLQNLKDMNWIIKYP